MEETLKLQLEAVDKFAALEKMLDSLQSIDKTLLKVNADLHKVKETNVFVKLSGQIDIAKTALGVFKSALSGVLGLFSKGIELGSDLFSSAINGQVFKQSTLIAFKTFFKSQEEAQRQYNHLFDVGEITPGTAERLKSATLKFAASGFSLPEIDTLQGLYADAQALGGTENGDNFASAISKIKNQGRLTGEALRFESIEKVGVGDILLDLGKKLKITGNPQDIKKKVNKLVSKGAIDSNLAITAIRDVSNAKLGNTKAGEYAIKLGRESLEGALSNVKEGFENLFRRLDLTNIPSLQQFLSNISSALKDPKTINKLEEAIDNLLGKLGSFSEKDFVSIFQTVSSVILSVSNALGVIFNYIQKIREQGFSTIFTDAIEGSKDLFIYIGTLLGQAIKESFLGGGDDIVREFERKRDEKKLKSSVEATGGTYNPEGINSYSYTIGPNGEKTLVKTGLSNQKLTQIEPLSPLDPSKQGNFVTINVDASNAKDPEAVGEAVAKAASKVLSDHHKNTRRDKQQKGL